MNCSTAPDRRRNQARYYHSSTLEATMWIDRLELDAEGDVEVTITGEYFPGDHGGWEDPGCDPEVSDIKATYNDKAVELTDEEYKEAEKIILKQVRGGW